MPSVPRGAIVGCDWSSSVIGQRQSTMHSPTSGLVFSQSSQQALNMVTINKIFDRYSKLTETYHRK